MAGTTVVFLAVVGARFLLPLAILKWPLPAIVGCLVLDGVDQTIFQAFGYDPPGYQSYDKAMDVFYLAVAYLAAMRNWTNPAAFTVARALYFYRLVGVLAFELTQWRFLLLVFPNTFEYFFIAYEALRLRWDPARRGLRFWVAAAAIIWVVVKLPQEWWIHVAKLDLTDEIAARAWLLPAILAAVIAVVVVARVRLVPALGPPHWSLRVAADPIPREMDSGAGRAAWMAEHARVLSVPTLEKVVLVGLLSVIYARVLPDLDASGLEIFIGLSVFVVVNSALSLFAARRSATVEGIAAHFVVRVAINDAIVLVSDRLLGRGDDIGRGATLFFVLLLSLMTVMHDRYWPVHEVRVSRWQPPAVAPLPRRSGGAQDRAGGTARG